MKIQQGLTSLFAGLFVAMFLLGTAGCSSGSGSALQMASSLPPTSPYGYVGATTCTQASLQGVLIKNPAGDAQVGTTATWQVSAGGCANMTFTPVGLSAIQVVAGTASYQRQYLQAANSVQESGTLSALNTAGQVVATITISSQTFNITSGTVTTGTLPCTVYAAQATLIAPVDQNGNPLSGPPTDVFTVTSDRAFRILSVQNMNGAFTPAVDPTQLPPAPALSFQAQIPAIGVDPIVFYIADIANPANQNTCTTTVTVQTQANQTVAPTCSLTISQDTFAPGASMVLTLAVTNGPAASLSLLVNGEPVAYPVIGPNTVYAPSVSGSATATVMSASGIANTCGVNFTIGTPTTLNLECDSQNNGKNGNTNCAVPGDLISATLFKTHGGKCTQGDTWGVDAVHNFIWTSGNCKGDFIVTYLE